MSKEYKISVAGVEYGMDRIRSGEIGQELFDAPGVGNTCCAVLTVSFWPEQAPPRNGEIRVYIREDGGPWTQLGVFWIDQRADVNGRLDVTAYDAMKRGEAKWEPEGLAFPLSMEAAARAIAGAMGTELDDRCAFNGAYTVDDPLGVYTMREVLGYIAAAHGGNWQVTAAGRLLLTPLYGSMPPETHYLVTEEGDAILFGDTRILI